MGDNLKEKRKQLRRTQEIPIFLKGFLSKKINLSQKL